ncbi:MAG: hypothetical protein HC771_01455 [Synechococcales cyanobacterium CRU_2_2]|nr:hypothetical protein [Synechococcales cyanobacterium CRU_2_2]
MSPTTNLRPIEATVTAFGRIQVSRYGDEQVQSVLFERWDRHDESRKIWKTFSVAEARLFRKNQQVRLTPSWRNERQSWSVERLGEPPVGSPPPYPTKSQYQEPEPEMTVSGTGDATVGEISRWLAHQADLYACCFSEAQRALSPQAPQEETVRACASSLFISATRKFRLET